MKIAIIGASYLQLPLYVKAKELGYYVIGFAWLDGSVAKDLCDKFYSISIIEKEQILEICKTEKIDGILTIATDIAVNTVNYVAYHLNLPGNSIESAFYSTNKFEMRKKLKNAGVNCPQFYSVKSVDDVASFESQIKYPVIVKPVDRSGSKGVTKVKNYDDLIKAVDKALNESFLKQAIVEEFIFGSEISVESISYNGVHYGLVITDKVTSGRPHFVELEHHQPSSLSEDMQILIFELVNKSLDALEIKSGASHSEFIISGSEIFVTEIGSRMGGDFIGSDLVCLSTGYDFLKGVLDVSVGKFEAPIKTKNNYAGVFFYSELTPHIGSIIKNNLHNDVKVRSEITSEELIPLTQSSDRSGYFIYTDNKRLKL